MSSTTFEAPSSHPAEQIAAVLAFCGRERPARDTRRLAQMIAHDGDLDRTIGALAVVQGADLSLALAYRASIEEMANPVVMVRRLRVAADDLDCRAELLNESAALDFGYAQARLAKHGKDDATAALLLFGAKRDQAEVERLTVEASATRAKADSLLAATQRAGLIVLQAAE